MSIVLRKAALLGTLALLAAMMWAGPAVAVENGPIFHNFSGGVYSIDPTASFNQRTIVGLGTSFDISADGKTLVSVAPYSSQCAGAEGHIVTNPLPFAYQGQCGAPVEIYNPDNSWDEVEDPEFSPDGGTIYFVVWRTIAPPGGTGEPTSDVAMYSVPTGGGEATRVPIDLVNEDGTPRNIYDFALSHDGSKFALAGDRGIFTVPVTGGVPTRVSSDPCGGVRNPNFSPDDQEIVYSASIRSRDDCQGTVHRTIYTTPAGNDGTRPGKPLFPEDATDAFPNFYDLSKDHPTFSPDGTSIAIANMREDADYLAIAPATGGSIKNIAYCYFCYPLWLEKPPPDTTIWSGPSGIVSSTTVTFGFSGGDAFECKLDDGTFERCSSPKTFTDLTEGPHTFEVRANSSAGTDATPAIRTFITDAIETSPDNRHTGVSRKVKPTLTFDTDLDPETIDGNSVKMEVYNPEKKRWVRILSGIPSYENGVITWTPDAILGSQKRYRLVLNTTIESATGKNLEQPYKFSFTTKR